jgi:thioredoxin 1
MLNMRKVAVCVVLALLLIGTATAQLLSTPIYNENADAKQEIREALVKAKTQHKRLLLVFGANWCVDCHVLDYRFHQSEIQTTLNKNFLVIHVDIGRGEKNVDLANKYNIPLNRGVPAIAVVDKSGALLFSQQHGEFAPMHRLPESDIIAFLQQWAPPGH